MLGFLVVLLGAHSFFNFLKGAVKKKKRNPALMTFAEI